jgi:hypothetical protein
MASNGRLADEMARIWKEAVVAYSRYYLRRSEENAEKYQEISVPDDIRILTHQK